MKIVSIVGARPQFVKAAVLRQAFEEAGIQEILVHTGQHYDTNMSSIFFEDLAIKSPDYLLQLTHRSHGAMTAEILSAIEEILLKESPDICLVYGDTNSTLAGALAASKIHIPVCHVEAGLRSFNKKMPEEINRILTDHVSDILFCSTYQSVENLKNEAITSSVHHVGDIMFDSVRLFGKNTDRKWNEDAKIPLCPNRQLACLTIHRAENLATKERAQDIANYVARFSDRYQFIFPIHPNTRNKFDAYEIMLEGVEVIDPLSYPQLHDLMASSALLMTDSGGMQKEAYFHGIKCITLRDETEWVETITHGWNRLWTSTDYLCKPKPIAEYGDGYSGEKIVKALQRFWQEGTN